MAGLGPDEPMLSIGCQDLIRSGCTHCGWLRKRNMLSENSHKFKALGQIVRKYIPWFQSYIVVKQGCMYWYTDEKATKPQKAKSLYGYNKVVRAREIEESEAVWCFKLVHYSQIKKPYCFSAYSEPELKIWMVKIKQEMCRANNKFEDVETLDTDSEGIARISFTYIEGSIYDDTTFKKPDDIVYDEDSDDYDDDYDQIQEWDMMPSSPEQRTFPGSPPNKNGATSRVPDRPPKVRGVPEDSKKKMAPVMSDLQKVLKNKNDIPARPPRKPSSDSFGSLSPTSPTSPTLPTLPTLPTSPTASASPVTPTSSNPWNKVDNSKKKVTRQSARLDKSVWHDETKFFDVVLFNSTDREAANRKVKEIGIEGVYLIRPGGEERGQKVLVVLVDGTPRKYKINSEVKNGHKVYSIASGTDFASLQDLLEYYYDNELPTGNARLKIPFTKAK